VLKQPNESIRRLVTLFRDFFGRQLSLG